jgi:ankyrin repeat protein
VVLRKVHETNTKEQARLRAEYLDHAVSVVTEGHETAKQRHELLNALLCAGASPGSRFIEDELFSAVRSHNIEIVKLLVSYEAAVGHDNARCLCAALESQDLGLVEVLLCGRLSSSILTKAVPLAMVFKARDQRLHAMKLLLGKRASGPEVDQALVDAIQQEDSKLFNELRNADVDINYSEGLPLAIAFRARNPAYLQCLCDRAPIEYATAARLLPIVLHPQSYQASRSAAIVKACNTQTSVLHKALTDEVAVHGAREEVITLLLDHGASVDASNGAALYQAALTGKQRAVQQLARAGASHSALHSAFRAVMSVHEVSSRFAIMKILLNKAGSQKIGQDDALVQEAKNAINVGTDIVDLLLKHDASPNHQNGEALKVAIDTRAVGTVRLLLAAGPNQDTLVTAFTRCMNLEGQLRIEYASMIAEEAMKAPIALPVGVHLERAISEDDLDLCKLLLHYGADPNSDGGKAFVNAARLPSTKIFEELLVFRPEIKRLLPNLIREINSEEKVIASLELCFERLHIQLNASENVLLFLALDQFEQGEQLIRLLLRVGCSPGATRELPLRSGSETESVTPLIWALSRPLPGPSKAVLLAILETELEAKPNFTSSTTQTSALLEAAKTGRHAILSKLLSLGTKVNAQDIDGNSALLLASEYGDFASVQALLQARVRPNDGSLHAAARGAHEQIVSLLLDHGHTPNHIHAGRSALAELCRNGLPHGSDWNERAYWVADVLIKRGTSLEARFAGKNLLHLALDNEMPLGILKVLLDFPQLSEHLNDDSLLFEDNTGTVYSPLSYAETFHTGPATEKAKLVKLLEDKNCARNMWNRQGKHPLNYTYNTMPPHLKSMVDQEKLDDLKHAKELKRREEEARIERELADRNHKHLMDQAIARHRLEVVEAQQREAQDAAADIRRHEAEKRHKREIATVEAQNLHNKHQLEISQQAALAMQRQQVEDRDRDRAFRHKKEMNQLEKQREQERLANQKALTWEQDRANEQLHVSPLNSKQDLDGIQQHISRVK